MYTAPAGWPPIGPRSVSRRLAAVTLVMGVWGGTAGLSVPVAGQVPSAPLNLRVIRAGGTAATGPQMGITCPAGAITISPGMNIQIIVNAHPGSTAFCLQAGTHSIKSSITPKTGNVFVGEYGAVLDGTGWTTTDSTQAAFRAHNQDIDDVTVRNLVIRNMPQMGIHAFYWMSNRWTVENNEILGARTGINAPNDSVIRRNYIHHNVRNASSTTPAERGGGYAANKARNVLFEDNEISYNGPEQKVTQTTNVTFRNNFVHHNLETGIWYDGDNVGALIEGNVVEDNPGEGIFYEISGQGVIRNNTVRRNGLNAIFMSTSRDVEIYGNTLEHNFRGVNLFVSCDIAGLPAGSPYSGAIGWDLRNNNVHDNTVVVGTRSGAIGNLLSTAATCSASQAATYLNGSKGNTFQANQYTVATIAGSWWYWGASKTWSEWQALGQDLTGAASQ